MKKENMLRLWLECLMIVVLAALMNINTLGAFLHERIGLAVILFAAVHLLLDRRQIVVLCKRIFKKNTPQRVRLGCIVDVLLLASFALVIYTGVGISITLLTDVQLTNRLFYLHLHSHAAYIMMLLVAVHLWQHKGWIKNMLRSFGKLWQSNPGRGHVLLWTLALVLAIGAMAYAAIFSEAEQKSVTSAAINATQTIVDRLPVAESPA